jgi:PAS domain S-box-containing protein
MAQNPPRRPTAEHEAARLAALRSYQILDSEPEGGFDDIVRIAAEICAVPMALISLVDDKRQWFKAAVGLTVAETPREIAFCAHAIEQSDVFLVEDATQDARFATNPLVTGDPNVRFYAGAPLQTPAGLSIGTLCVLDSKPRTLSESQRIALEALGRQVITQMELRQALARQRAEEKSSQLLLEHQAALLTLSDGLHVGDTTSDLSFCAAEVLGHTLKLSRAGYGSVAADGRTFMIERDWTAPGTVSVAGSHAGGTYGSYHADLERGLTVVVSDTETDPRIRSGAMSSLDVRAFIALPLVEMDRLVAVLFVHSAAPRAWHAADLNFVREVAGRTRAASARRRAEIDLRELAASLETQVGARLDERNRLWSGTNELMATAGLNGYLKEANPAWTRLLGWDERTLLSRPLIDLVEPADHAGVAAVIDRLKAGETVLDFTATLRAQDGSTRVVTWSAVPEDDLFYIVGRDVTLQRDMEERLRQGQKMEAVGQLTGGIAHDFNNMLAGILGSIALIRLRCRSGRYEGLERLIDTAEKSAKSAASLTARLLAFSRRQSLDVKASDVNQLVAGMGDLLHRTLGETVDLRTVLQGDLWAALTDANQLENAILNLAINARDAMPAGGRLTIETSNVGISPTAAAARGAELAAGDYVRVSVSDTGCGMSPEVAARAFDPFFTTKPVGEGTGLGLSMIYGFAKQSAGVARIRSEVGRGTTLELYLPRGVPAADTTTVKEGVLAQGEGQRLLVVEDDDTLRSLISDALRELGYEIVEAAHPQSAMRILDSEIGVDLLVTDVGLPHMNGRQLAAMAGTKRPRLKVLFLTGYAENAADRGALEDGMQMLTKPFTLDALAGKVQEMLRA